MPPSTYRVDKGGFFTVYLEGLNEVNSLIDKATSQLSNTKPLLEESRLKWRDRIRSVFASEGGATGVPWPELRPLTVRLRGESGPILDETGSLAHAAAMEQSAFQARGPHNAVDSAQTYERIASSYVIADNKMLFTLSGPEAAHQDGYTNAMTGNVVPARPFWPWGDTEWDLLTDPFEKWADDWAAGGG
jgi:hypothetical protein